MIDKMCAVCHAPGPPTVAEVHFEARGRQLTGYRPVCGECLAPWVPVGILFPKDVENVPPDQKTDQETTG